ncbi:MAG: orotidine-5'-phosphate decarboxylase [Bacteriovoracia bacterium]
MSEKNATQTELIVALDFATAAEAFALVEKLKGLPVVYKVGLELFQSGGSELVRKLVSLRQRVFVDLKFHDIPNTVAKSAAQVARMGAEMFTLHVAGGPEMVQATVRELAPADGARSAARPKILGVTVLTSFDEDRWSQAMSTVSAKPYVIGESVKNMVRQAKAWGVDGIVCSSHELEALREEFAGLYTVVPGIRPAGTAAQDQGRTMTPKQAAQLGAGAIVVGRPITQAADPRAATEAILKELSG